MNVVVCVMGLLVAGCVEATPSETSQRSYFQSNVQPILINRCAHSGCHGNGNGSFVAFDVYSYDSLAARFDLLEPGKPYPRLLTKAAGIEQHAAGPLLDVGSEAFFVLQAWLDNGATDE
jgi:hypothetical protein